MHVKQAANVVDLLEFYADRKSAATLADVSQHFGWPRSSTFNLISTLVSRGFLYEPKPRGGFYPTPRWLHLSREIASAEPVSENIRRLLEELWDKAGETICFTALSGQYAVFLDAIESLEAVRYSVKVGDRLPLHATASGMAILSQLTEAQRGSILRKAKFERHGEGTLMSVEAVEDAVRASLLRGYFQSASAYSRGLGGVAVPLVLGDRVFAVTIAGPLFRVENRVDEFANLLHRVTAKHLGADYFAKNVANLGVVS